MILINNITIKYIMSLVSDALEYYDINKDKYDVFFRKVKRIEFKRPELELEHYRVIFYDRNDQKIGESRYENLGLYSDKNRIWTWAWSISTFARNTINIIKNILNYGIDIDNKDRFLKDELITSRFKISNKIQIDIHVAIASYLSKQPAIFFIKKPTGTEHNEIVQEIDFYNEDDNIYYFMFILDHEDLIDQV